MIGVGSAHLRADEGLLTRPDIRVPIFRRHSSNFRPPAVLVEGDVGTAFVGDRLAAEGFERNLRVALDEVLGGFLDAVGDLVQRAANSRLVLAGLLRIESEKSNTRTTSEGSRAVSTP